MIIRQFITRHTLAWKGVLVVFFLCPITIISATMAPISVKFCTVAHIGPGEIFFPFGGGTLGDPQNSKLWA